jgi:hypothetical protein
MVSSVSGSVSNANGTTVATLQVSFGVKDIRLRRLKVHHTGGAANHFHPYIFNDPSCVVDDICQEFAGAQTNAAGLYDSAGSIVEVPCLTDVFGRLYLKFAPNTGSNNSFDFVLYYEAA